MLDALDVPLCLVCGQREQSVADEPQFQHRRRWSGDFSQMTVDIPRTLL